MAFFVNRFLDRKRERAEQRRWCCREIARYDYIIHEAILSLHNLPVQKSGFSN